MAGRFSDIIPLRRSAILAERFLFHRTHFPMKQKTRLLCFQRRRAIFTRVTTSVHLCLAAQTSTGTFIPYRYNRRNLSQPWYALILRCASQKPSSTYPHSLSLSIRKPLCKTRHTCTLFVTVFTYMFHAITSCTLCKHPVREFSLCDCKFTQNIFKF